MRFNMVFSLAFRQPVLPAPGAGTLARWREPGRAGGSATRARGQAALSAFSLARWREPGRAAVRRRVFTRVGIGSPGTEKGVRPGCC
jgi:hypothetical protein